MPTLAPTERRALRARAHALRPVVYIGQHGLTPAVLHEIDVSLRAHQLIKVRVGSGDREARDAALARICTELDAAPVQHIGKLLVIYRPAPLLAPESARAKSGAKKAPQVRRPRTPLPRTPPRPVPPGPRSRIPAPSPSGPRHRGGATRSGPRGKFRDEDTAAMARRGKPPRSVTADMGNDEAAPARRRARTAPPPRARRDERAPPAPSFETRGSSFGNASGKPRPAGGPRPKRRVGALPEKRGPAANARRRRTPR